MFNKYFIPNLAAALGYFMAGEAGMMLAIPPSNAAAVWPAAGIALALMTIFGKKILPGILLGGLLVQTMSFLDISSIEKCNRHVLVGHFA